MNIVEAMALKDSQAGFGAPAEHGGVFDALIGNMMAKKEEDRKKKNIETQMKTAKQMMEQMAQYSDASTSGKAGSLTDITEGKDRRGITGVSILIPTQEFSFDESGAPSMKIGFKSASPTEQKSLIDIEQAKRNMQIDEEKRRFRTDYITGRIPDGAFIQEMGNLGLTADDYVQAKELRDQLQKVQPFASGTLIPGAMSMVNGQVGDVQGNVIPRSATPPITASKGEAPAGYRVSAYEPDKFGNIKPKGFEPIPATERKAEAEMASTAKAEALKSEGAIKAAENTIKSIDHLTQNIKYFGPIEGRMPAGLNTGKREWAKNYDYLQASNILNVLREMKSQSSTGATGFGALNEKELAIIENAAMKLDKQMEEVTAAKYLKEMRDSFQTIVDREKNGYQGMQQVPVGGGDVRSQYNALRASGVSAEQAKAQLGLK